MTCLAGRGDVVEARPSERRRRAHGGVQARTGLDRIPFHDRGPVRPRVVHRSLQKAKRDPLPADPAIDEEADHRPYGCIVDTREGPGPLQGRVRVAWGNRADAAITLAKSWPAHGHKKVAVLDSPPLLAGGALDRRRPICYNNSDSPF
jgi:hypothetical protein